MKKFLSLVLAVIMTMSLVTISAGATEYRDLTDKDEIQYEEAVAVLNRIGVITGYDDGSFRPEGELTRGAAAKIIVSLLIGPDAASNLPNATAPYPDVPSSHTFAGVISYCKTAGIISGYGDGTFKPGNSLTGFAFAKMLLGALGYKSNIEGFVDTGWTMNVAKVGNAVGLFDRLSFDGSAAVNREEACQLALNTLKATMVTYGGTTVVSGTQTLAVGSTQAVYVTSNNRDINANINRRVINAVNNEMTLEFGEEHFKDLRLEHDKYDPAYDIYGHPSNEWSYKKVTIGTFPLEADFTFTKQMAHREETVAAKEKALGLRNYDTYSTDHRAQYTNWSTASSGTQYNSPFNDATQITINGYDARVLNSNYDQTTAPSGTLEGNLFSYDASKVKEANKEEAPSLSEICDLTDNGVTVEVYVCPVDADFITNVVVTRTQLMEVDHIGSDYVSLEDIGPDSRDPRKAGALAEITGYNDFAIDVNVQDVKDDNYDAYNVLSALKVGDRVAIIPYTADDGRTWEVGEAYVPETASGALSKVILYANTNKADGNAVGLVVGGTEYPINEWNLDVIDANGSQIKATRKDVTVYLAKDGTVLWADEIGDSDNWMVVGDYYQGTNTATGKVTWFVHGWTIGGEEVDLDLGTIRGAAEKYAPGELVRYKIATAGTGEYQLTKPSYSNRPWLYKNGNPAPEETPITKTVVTKTRGTQTYKTGEGIYEIAQYAKTVSGTSRAYSIATGNSDLALEGYAAQKLVNDVPVYTWGDGTSQYQYQATGPKWINKNLANQGDVNLVPPTGGQEPAHVFDYNYTSYDGVKFIFVSFEPGTGEVETIDIQSGVKNVSYEDLCKVNEEWINIGTGAGASDRGNFVANAAEAYVDDSGKVKAVVIKDSSSEANLTNIAVITDTRGTDQFSKGAETELDGYTRQYRVGPNFDEELTGTFDRAYNVGDILTIRKDGDLIIGKYFHADSYQNTNPDVLLATSIKAVQTHTGSNSKSAFQITGYTHADGSAVSEKVAIMDKENILGDDQFDNQDYATERQGLVTVDSKTIFIDQRVGHRDDEIDSLGDLLDRDLTSVRVKVLLNGKTNTETYRHAYAVVVLTAPEKTDDASTPAISLATSLDPLTAVEGQANTFYVPADKTFVLTANVSNLSKMGTLSYTWVSSTEGDLDNNKSTLKVVGGLAAGEKATYTVTVLNTDTSRADNTKAEGTAKITLIGKAGVTPTGTQYVRFPGEEATLNGAAIGQNGVKSCTGGTLTLQSYVTIPEYAQSGTLTNGNLVEIKADMYHETQGLVKADATVTVTAAAGATQATVEIASDANQFLSGDGAYAEIKSIKWKSVGLKFIDEQGTDISDLFSVSTFASAHTATNVGFTLNTTADSGKVTFTYVSGLQGTVTKVKEIDLATPGSNTIAAFFDAPVLATGDDWVTIKVSGLDKLKEKVVISNVSALDSILVRGTGKAVTGSSEAFALVFDAGSGDLTTGVDLPESGTLKDVKVYLAFAGTGSEKFAITLNAPNNQKVGPTVVDQSVSGTSLVELGTIDLTESWQIAESAIEITAPTAAPAKSGTVDPTFTENGVLYDLVVTFDKPIKSKTGDPADVVGAVTPATGGGSCSVQGVTISGSTLTIRLDFVDGTSGNTSIAITSANLVTDDVFETPTAVSSVAIAQNTLAITVT